VIILAKIAMKPNACPGNHACPCVKICPAGAITQKDANSEPELHPEKCIACGACVKSCGKQALYLAE